MKYSLTCNINLRKRLLLAAAALVLAVPLLVAPTSRASAEALDVDGADTSAADPIHTCGSAPADKDGSSWGKYFKVNGVNIRKSPSTASKICAQGQKSHVVDYHCWTRGSDGSTWTFVRDATTHYAGWVRDSLLKNNGSYVHC
jgi:hypothetical protein